MEERFRMNDDNDVPPGTFKYIVIIFFIILSAAVGIQAYLIDKKITKEEEKLTELETLVISVHEDSKKERERLDQTRKLVVDQSTIIEKIEKK